MITFERGGDVHGKLWASGTVNLLGSIEHIVDWTEGCIAVSNSEIQEAWRLVRAGTPIEIIP